MSDEDDKPAAPKKKSRPIHPVEAAQLLLAAIDEADETTRTEWNRAVVREMDMDAGDFMIGLRRIAGGS